NFCEYIVNAFKDYTTYYAIGNEFNLQGPGGWHPYENYQSNHNADNYSHYVKLIKTAYPVIKDADPNAVVIGGEIGRYEDEWANECYDLGIADYMDIFSYHIYGHGAAPERYVDEMTTYSDGSGYSYHDLSPWASASKWRDLVSAHTNTQTGDKNGAWLTEIGVASRSDAIVSRMPELPVTHTEQARILVRTYALVGHDIDKIFLYNFTNNEMEYFGTDGENALGIINAHDHRTPFAAKPAYIAISAYTHFTSGNNAAPPAPEYIGNEADYRERGYKLTFTGTQYGTTVMAWKSERGGNKVASLSIPGAENLDVYDLNGNYLDTVANGTNWTLSIDPIYAVKAN
ncbi:MAG: hypothetical protein IJO50_03285, partial [Clostridia bacterium]|nr:hypothetical protein [Clostridia bacterium]